jgi:hypothetical protein
MKKMYILASLLLFSGAMMAQSSSATVNNAQDASLKAANEIPAGWVAKQNPSSFNKSQEDVVFSDDFANGLDGNNELSLPWTTGGTIGDEWQLSTSGPSGNYSSNTGPLESATSANGFMLLDCDEYNSTPTGGTTAIDVSGWITTPELDLSALGSVLVDFSTYFRYCCSNNPDIFPALLGVSTDGGTNWTNYRMFGYNQFIMGANNQSGTLDVTVDISASAANQSSVLIRFAFNPDVNSPMSHYYLGVDDVAVYENPYANNLAVLQVMNNDVFNVWEVKNYPLEQSPEILAGAVYGNYGSAPQTGVEILFEVLDADNNVLSSSVEVIGDVPLLTIDTVYHSTGYALADLGNYTLRATVSSDQDEEVVENTVGNRYLTVTTATMSYEDMDNMDTQSGPRDNDAGTGFNEGGYANYFFVEAEGSAAHGVEVVFGNNTTVGTEVFIQFFNVTGADINADADNMPVDELTIADYVVQAEDLNNAVYIPFEEEIDLEVGEAYFLTVRQFAGTEEMWVRQTFNVDTDNSSYERDLNSDQEPTWFSTANENGVRLALNMSLGVEDLANTIASINVSPNPFSESTRIEYTLSEKATVAYTLFDVNGRLIDQVKLGNQAAGAQSIVIDGASLEAGIYYFNLRIGDSATTEKLIVTK